MVWIVVLTIRPLIPLIDLEDDDECASDDLPILVIGVHLQPGLHRYAALLVWSFEATVRAEVFRETDFLRLDFFFLISSIVGVLWYCGIDGGAIPSKPVTEAVAAAEPGPAVINALVINPVHVSDLLDPGRLWPSSSR